ncbi:hypothetical protein T11_14262 [Trichinella zimbabwensis]|uniref:Uncharacterized protein n=3 Tax=Trichinella TaxID=6333 RepID=A0A0V1MB46_9BILA|nr:hypothetical protein T06_9594 [Trichinella sp. T6]KRZ11795.1 hypothetical protein T11_14262 [Trichinella zimbabwensis]KRZ58977.1 hypothetical protein T02_3530 [Trichinella nativa]KRZ69108.1 hypothetical protein T10_7315 [Trichinella papuae]
MNARKSRLSEPMLVSRPASGQFDSDALKGEASIKAAVISSGYKLFYK